MREFGRRVGGAGELKLTLVVNWGEAAEAAKEGAGCAEAAPDGSVCCHAPEPSPNFLRTVSELSLNLLVVARLGRLPRRPAAAPARPADPGRGARGAARERGGEGVALGRRNKRCGARRHHGGCVREQDSSWVADRAPLEALMRSAEVGPINELLLATESGGPLEGWQTSRLRAGSLHGSSCEQASCSRARRPTFTRSSTARCTRRGRASSRARCGGCCSRCAGGRGRPWCSLRLGSPTQAGGRAP